MNRQLVVHSPALLCLSEDNNLRPTMRFLLEELGMDRTTSKQVSSFMLGVARSFMCEADVLWAQWFLSSRYRFRIGCVESLPFETTFHMCSSEETCSTQYFKAGYAFYSNTPRCSIFKTASLRQTFDALPHVFTLLPLKGNRQSANASDPERVGQSAT